MKEAKALLLFSLLLSGCSSSKPTESPSAFDGGMEVRVSDETTPYQRGIVTECVARWGYLLDGSVGFRNVVVSPTDLYDPRANTINIIFPSDRRKDGLVGHTDRYAREDGRTLAATILIFDKDDVDEQRWSCLHEMGHALGLSHDEDRSHNSVMWPVVSFPIQIGCEDWRRVCQIWHCEARCEGQSWL